MKKRLLLLALALTGITWKAQPPLRWRVIEWSHSQPANVHIMEPPAPLDRVASMDGRKIIIGPHSYRIMNEEPAADGHVIYRCVTGKGLWCRIFIGTAYGWPTYKADDKTLYLMLDNDSTNVYHLRPAN